MTQSVEEMHRAVRDGRSPAFAELMDKVYEAMSPLERAPLPRRYPEEVSTYVNALVGYALLNLADFGADLKNAVSGHFKQRPARERFIFDPLRGSKREVQCLFLDANGELVTVRHPKLERDRDSGDIGRGQSHRYHVDRERALNSFQEDLHFDAPPFAGRL